MASATSVEPTGGGVADLHENVLRPRPRKPAAVVAHLAQISRTASSQSAQSAPSQAQPLLALPASLGGGDGTGTAVSSGRSTPVPVDAPPSVKSLSSARRHARAEAKRRINSRRLFPTVDFTSRVSHFDPASEYRDFHGFFNLFWIGLAIMAITTMLRNIKDTGSPMRVHIWGLFTHKLWDLAVADFLMAATTAVSLPLHRTLFRPARPGSPWTWARGGVALQSLYQAAWMAVWVAVPFVFTWSWTAQVFLLLHAMVLLMKMHSYAFYNGHLSETEKRLKGLDDPGTADTAPAYLYPTADKPMGAMADPRHKRRRRGDDGNDGNRPRHRDRQSSGGADGGNSAGGSDREDVATVVARDDDDPADHDPADHDGPADHDDRSVSVDGDEISELRTALARELTSPMGNVTYPRNLTWANYLDYLLCPTLCYEIEYPRMPSINWTSLVSKIVATFGCIFLLTIVSEEFIVPVLLDSSVRLAATASASESLLILAETVSWLLFPFMVTFLLVFLVIFEYVLGAFAEITRFADRHFYSDWWNSTDWMGFSREWNVPVHAFLRRHVYSASRPHIGRGMATVVTFLISAFGHEVVMACITKKLRGYGFICQMMQLPLIMVQRLPAVRGKKTLNNVCFWCSMILGLSVICSLYVLV